MLQFGLNIKLDVSEKKSALGGILLEKYLKNKLSLFLQNDLKKYGDTPVLFLSKKENISSNFEVTNPVLKQQN